MIDSWVVVVVLVAVIVAIGLLRRRPRRRAGQDGGLFMPRVEGFLVTTPLHPRMTRGCVFDLGLQYGRGFRRKEGPALPHGPECQCRTAAFAFSGNEVFNGSLRKLGEELRCTVPGFPVAACKPLLDALKRVNAERVPDTLSEYLAQVGKLEGLAAEHEEPVRRFLEERHTYLRGLVTPAETVGVEPPRPSGGP